MMAVGIVGGHLIKKISYLVVQGKDELVREKSGESQGILQVCGNPVLPCVTLKGVLEFRIGVKVLRVEK